MQTLRVRDRIGDWVGPDLLLLTPLCIIVCSHPIREKRVARVQTIKFYDPCIRVGSSLSTTVRSATCNTSCEKWRRPTCTVSPLWWRSSARRPKAEWVLGLILDGAFESVDHKLIHFHRWHHKNDNPNNVGYRLVWGDPSPLTNLGYRIVWKKQGTGYRIVWNFKKW